MKRYAGSIDPDQGHIFHKCHTDWEFRTVFREPGNSVDAFETFYDGFFMMDWISDGLKSLLLMEFALATQNLPFFGM